MRPAPPGGLCRKWRSRALLVLIAVVLSVSPGATAPVLHLAIQPLGPFDRALLEEVSRSLESTFTMEVTTLAPEPMPATAFYPPRGRYRASLLLDHLQAATNPTYDRVLGLTASDISITKGAVYDWGIFGLAYLSARPCVVSAYRLKRNAPPALLRARLLKVARHEVGHTLRLEHCVSPGCVMADASGSIKPVDASDGSFCSACRAKLGTYLRSPEGKILP